MEYAVCSLSRVYPQRRATGVIGTGLTTEPSFLFQSGLILRDETPDPIRHSQELLPLLAYNVTKSVPGQIRKPPFSLTFIAVWPRAVFVKG
jgi:hypothetical protein